MNPIFSVLSYISHLFIGSTNKISILYIDATIDSYYFIRSVLLDLLGLFY